MVNKPLQIVWSFVGLPPDHIECIELSNNPDPSIDSAFKIGTAAQTSVGLSALAAAYFHHLRLPKEITESEDYYPQRVKVDSQKAVLEFSGERYYTINGKLPPTWIDDPISDLYPTRNGRYVRLGCNFPHHKRGMLEMLGVPDNKEAVAAAMLEVDAHAFVEKAQASSLCAAVLNDFDAVDMSAHGQSAATFSPVRLTRIEGVPEAPPRSEQIGLDTRPLAGIRMLDMTRLLSAPLAGRTMAMHGADVLYVTSPHLTAVPEYDQFTTMGKRTTQLDLDDSEQCKTLFDLVKDADVFVQSYRPGSFPARGLGPQDVAKMRPGIIYAAMGTFSHTSSWWFRKGFARDIEILSGHVCEEARVYKEWLELQGEDTSEVPEWRNTPVCAVAHLTGLFLTFGIIAALCKTITEGGSWEVHVSLESVALWMRNLGMLTADEVYDEEDRDMPQLPPRERDPARGPSKFGLDLDDRVAAVSQKEWEFLSCVSHAAELELTPAIMGKAPVTYNAHKPRWLPRETDDIARVIDSMSNTRI
ncbi:CoA-transferase family III [Vararia minispora EC-137]|uniref:CoA-transferase family III n=1 Tax=Vararia minispora EC-137 TaxID=1314806 RepID=A0ACB8QBG7_9AGAM|nr:CoA-transferase family III [Vararia minispora EC-137]